MDKFSVLIVEDNLLVSTTVQDILSDEGYVVKIAEDGKTAEDLLARGKFNVVVLDMMLPDTDGRNLLEKWRKSYPQIVIIIMTAYGDVSTAVECLKSGAYDFLTKPVDKALLTKTLGNAVEHFSLSKKVSVLTQLTTRKTDTVFMGGIIGQSAAVNSILDMARLISESDFSCLFIKGESGTGKGLFAKTIHKLGKRAAKPFVELNCSAMPINLIESELFGYKTGAFTDAKEDKIGLFELADQGTLFLDEIGDMDVSLQIKLLKAIEEQRFRRLGCVNEISVDICIIAATNQDVETLVANGKFRADLYYRLNVIPIDLPPLRDRIDDLPLLADHFINIFSRKFGKNITGFSKKAMDSLWTYSWPGNVREFRNVVERGCILSKGPLIDSSELLFPNIFKNKLPEANSESLSLPAMPLDKAEVLVIRAAMTKAKGNKNKAAQTLGVHRTTLYKKLEEYSISTADFI